MAMKTKSGVRRSRILTLLAAVGLFGCATTQVKTDYDPQANFSKYRTFAVQQGKVIPEPGTVAAAEAVPNSLVQDRIDAALSQELEAKGMQPVKTNPDLIVTYAAGARTKEEVISDWGAFGWAYDPAFNDVWIQPVEQSTLVIDLIDAGTKKLVFRAVAKADNKDIQDPKFVQKAVDKALAQYPPAGA
jgi:hypothetical protein